MTRVTLADFPGAPRTAYIEDGWLVVGDQAWTVKEWSERKHRKYDPEYARRWRAVNREYVRAYKRDWQRRRRTDPEYRERERASNRAYWHRTHCLCHSRKVA